MYKCDNCGKLTQPKQSILKVVVEKRNKIYGKKFDEVSKKYVEIKGQEIVKELNVCPKCYEKLKEEGY